MAPTTARIVIAEDDPSMREALERLLRVAGFEVRGHASAEELLADGTAAEAFCVVSDLRLPGWSGLELLDRMRSLGWSIPLILITAHDAPGLREEVLHRGAAAYLAKPFAGTALLAAIGGVIKEGYAHEAPGRRHR